MTLDDGIFHTWPRVATPIVKLDRTLVPPPPQFGIAEQEELTEGGDLEKAIELYESCLTDDVPLPWRRLARLGIAACEKHLKRPMRALRQFEHLLLMQTIPHGARYKPTRFDILLARIDVLGSDPRLIDQAGPEALDLLAQINAGGALIEDVYDAQMLFKRIEAYAPGQIDDIQAKSRTVGTDARASTNQHSGNRVGQNPAEHPGRKYVSSRPGRSTWICF